ncbi:MAG: ATP-binding protein [Candidatus Altiarchaeota archaeon]|nr:ATP-binding protein [Candidatus Altiarchaeota archaeon]
MVIQFKDRVKELKELEDALDSDRFELTVIYGRRRIGKTELILSATKNRERIYYLAVGEKNLERFYEHCLRHFPEVSRLRMDWITLFEFLKNNVDVIIIDEFQNLIKEDGNILHIFQSITDLTLKDSQLKMFLLGSSVSMMTSKVLSHKSPLYGRRTGSMELKAIPFFELDKFFPKYGIKELIEIYGLADGIPLYLMKIDRKFWPWLHGEILRGRSFLRDEVDFLMRYEFEDVSTYKLILEAIAHGKTKMNEIKDFMKVRRTDISPYLRNLVEVKMIQRTVPVTEKTTSRRGRYYLSDNFIKFWFRYIYPNMSAIEEGIYDVKQIRADYNNYLGPVFENVARQFLVRERKNIFDFNKIGRWWYKDNEIDIIALSEQTKKALFCECKWKENISAGKIFNELRIKSGEFQWHNDERTECFTIFAKSFKEKIDTPNLMLFDLKDLEEAFK